MRRQAELGFNIMIIGRWNPAIFAPQWIRKNVLSSDDEVIMAMPLGNPLALPRLSFSGVHLFVGSEFLEIRPEALRPANISTCATVASKLLEFLCHTPITAIGINVRFEDDVPSDAFDNLFSFPDQGLISPTKYQLGSSTIARNFALGATDSLNLSITQGPALYQIEFNFHTESQEMETIRSKTSEVYIQSRIDQAKQFMLDTYNASIDD
jgi:hypothetical protein